MKKLLIFILFVVMGITTSMAEILWFKTTDFAYRIKNYGTWSSWSDWEASSMNIKIDTGQDIIVIYSPETQVYKVLSLENPPYDSNGTQVKFKVIDQDFDIGYIRLRVEHSGNSQIYVDFSNVSWVYNVVRTE